MVKNLFRAYDIRGIYNVELNAEICLHIGQGIGTYIKREMNGMKD